MAERLAAWGQLREQRVKASDEKRNFRHIYIYEIDVENTQAIYDTQLPRQQTDLPENKKTDREFLIM